MWGMHGRGEMSLNDKGNLQTDDLQVYYARSLIAVSFKI
jgi:hypothetical protein